MRTYIFKDFLNDKNGKFLPLQTVESEDFGRHFFIDIAFEFLSAPSLESGGYDESQLDYVSNWTDMEGVDLGKLLDINRRLCWDQWQEDREKAHRVAKKLRSGCVYINGNAADAGTPFGGYRQSGNGREGGVWGLDEYLEVKTVTGWK